MKNQLEQIKLFYKDNLIVKNLNNDFRAKLDIQDTEILFDIGLPNSMELDFKFTREIKYFKDNVNELILDDSESGKIIYNITNELVCLYFDSKKIILNIGLFRFLFSIYYYELFLNNWKNDKKNKKNYFNDFEGKMKILNNNYEGLDYYWEAIIEELSPI